jgi:hypothetical protein
MTTDKFILWHGGLCTIDHSGISNAIDCPLEPDVLCTTECQYLKIYGPCVDMPTLAILTCVEPNVEVKLEDYNV